jgi:hypothetical protein
LVILFFKINPALYPIATIANKCSENSSTISPQEGRGLAGYGIKMSNKPRAIPDSAAVYKKGLIGNDFMVICELYHGLYLIKGWQFDVDDMYNRSKENHEWLLYIANYGIRPYMQGLGRLSF